MGDKQKYSAGSDMAPQNLTNFLHIMLLTLYNNNKQANQEKYDQNKKFCVLLEHQILAIKKFLKNHRSLYVV